MDYSDDEQTEQAISETVDPPEIEANDACVSIFNSGFCDFIQQPEILFAIDDCDFEYPYKVQYQFMPQAVIGRDILCQARSGMGKVTGYVLATLEQLEPTESNVCALILCNTRARAFHISKEYERFAKYIPELNVGVFIGGLPIKKDEELLKTMKPHIVVGTPGRILALIQSKKLNLKQLKHFIVDDCQTTLGQLDMRRNILDIFRNTPSEKQVMMFATSISKDVHAICKKFMQFDAIEIL